MQVDFRTLQAGDPNSTSSEGVFLDDGVHKLSDPTIISTIILAHFRRDELCSLHLKGFWFEGLVLEFWSIGVGCSVEGFGLGSKPCAGVTVWLFATGDIT